MYKVNILISFLSFSYVVYYMSCLESKVKTGKIRDWSILFTPANGVQ